MAFLENIMNLVGMMVHTFSSNTQEAETKVDGAMGVCSQPGLHCEFQASQEHNETLSQKEVEARGQRF